MSTFPQNDDINSIWLQLHYDCLFADIEIEKNDKNADRLVTNTSFIYVIPKDMLGIILKTQIHSEFYPYSDTALEYVDKFQIRINCENYVNILFH